MTREEFVEKWADGYDWLVKGIGKDGYSKEDMLDDLDSVIKHELSLPPADATAEEILDKWYAIMAKDREASNEPFDDTPYYLKAMHEFAAQRQSQPTADGAEEILQKYMDASMIICPLHVVPRTVALSAMHEFAAQRQPQPTVSNEKQYPFCPTCGDTIEHDENYGGYCCTKCRDGHNNDLAHKEQPTAEGAEEFTKSIGIKNNPFIEFDKGYYRLSEILEKFATLTADKIVEGKLREELLEFHKWQLKHEYASLACPRKEFINMYLKTRSHE